jgi:lipoate-protein ligase B
VLALQRKLHERVAVGDEPDTWLVVEHEPVVTLGRGANRGNVLLDERALAKRGLEVIQIERGGDATYHGPGQLVVYPIVRLKRFREVVPLVSALEAAIVAALAAFGILGQTQKHRGVYVGENAICAIGLAVKQMTTLHGFSLNVSTDLDYDRIITPCGSTEFGITSLSCELGRPVAIAEALDEVLAAASNRLSIGFQRVLVL